MGRGHAAAAKYDQLPAVVVITYRCRQHNGPLQYSPSHYHTHTPTHTHTHTHTHTTHTHPHTHTDKHTDKDTHTHTHTFTKHGSGLVCFSEISMPCIWDSASKTDVSGEAKMDAHLLICVCV